MVRGVLAHMDSAIERFGRRMRCVPRILAAQNARLGSPLSDEDLADLTQDTLMVIWRKLDQYSPSYPLEGWVYRISTLELLNFVRKKRRRNELLRDLAEERAGAVEAGTEGREESGRDLEELQRGLATLEEKEARVIRLKHFEDRTFEEIAQDLSISQGTAKTRYYRGMLKMRAFFESRGAGA